MELLSRGSSIIDDLWSDGRGYVLIAVSGGWFLSIGIRMIYPVLLPYIRVDFNISLTVAGLLLTMLWFAYALGQTPGGIWADRLGERKVLGLSTLVSGVALVIISLSNVLTLLFVATVLFGIATALFGVARFTVLSNLYTKRDGTAIGLTMAAGDVGNALMPPIAGLTAAVYSWRFGFSFAIPLFFMMTVILWVAIPAQSTRSNGVTNSFTFDTLQYVFRNVSNRSVLIVVFIQLLGFWVWQGFTGFYPLYLTEVKGISPGISSVVFGLFFIIGIVIKPASGGAYDRFGIGWTVIILSGTMAVSLCMLVIFANTLVAILLLTPFLGAVLGMATVTLSHLTNLLPKDMQGTGLGLIRSFYITIGSLSPTVIGLFADYGYFDHALLLFALFSIVILIAAWNIK
ncbi:MFS transporter [Natrarchaeobius chitinivorans]|uniref:MFS transporter n=1 Tax=Natrarchaeobius chitinivorans TaxID=1679083 RepID=A0A3N6MFC5_NATCH|nr:MFS transporter [Natrarchaeobius chitinivorans]RQG95420.1 MFS transporter [Natrarchaeobius chitinivorans]